MGLTLPTYVRHYGLMAEHWAEFKTDAPDIPYYLAATSAAAPVASC